MNPTATPSHLPAITALHLVLIYRVHLTSSKVPKKGLPQKLAILNSNLSPKYNVFVEK